MVVKLRVRDVEVGLARAVRVEVLHAGDAGAVLELDVGRDAVAVVRDRVEDEIQGRVALQAQRGVVADGAPVLQARVARHGGRVAEEVGRARIDARIRSEVLAAEALAPSAVRESVDARETAASVRAVAASERVERGVG